MARAVHPLDNVNRGVVGSSLAEKVFKPGEILGELATLLGSASAVYAVRRLKDEPSVSHVRTDLIQSLAMSEAVVQTLKYTTRRECPDRSGRNSFPSGDAVDTFALRQRWNGISVGGMRLRRTWRPRTSRSRDCLPNAIG